MAILPYASRNPFSPATGDSTLAGTASTSTYTPPFNQASGPPITGTPVGNVAVAPPSFAGRGADLNAGGGNTDGSGRNAGFSPTNTNPPVTTAIPPPPPPSPPPPQPPPPASPPAMNYGSTGLNDLWSAANNGDQQAAQELAKRYSASPPPPGAVAGLNNAFDSLPNGLGASVWHPGGQMPPVQLPNTSYINPGQDTFNNKVQSLFGGGNGPFNTYSLANILGALLGGNGTGSTYGNSYSPLLGSGGTVPSFYGQSVTNPNALNSLGSMGASNATSALFRLLLGGMMNGSYGGASNTQALSGGYNAGLH